LKAALLNAQIATDRAARAGQAGRRRSAILSINGEQITVQSSDGVEVSPASEVHDSDESPFATSSTEVAVFKPWSLRCVRNRVYQNRQYLNAVMALITVIVMFIPYIFPQYSLNNMVILSGSIVEDSLHSP
jgi:hypothetical protein